VVPGLPGRPYQAPESGASNTVRQVFAQQAFPLLIQGKPRKKREALEYSLKLAVKSSPYSVLPVACRKPPKNRK